MTPPDDPAGSVDTRAIQSGAIISECGTYRYALERNWGGYAKVVAFIMLNPSTADATKDDPTIRRCIGFAKAWGCTGLRVLNLFALRSTDPKALYSHPDPIGPENDDYLREWSADSQIVVAAWGVHGKLRGRGTKVRGMVPGLQALGVTKDGHPKHPLYVAAATALATLANGAALAAAGGDKP